MEFQLRYESAKEYVDAVDSGKLRELVSLLEGRSINGICIFVDTSKNHDGAIHPKSMEILPPRRDGKNSGYMIILDHGQSSLCKTINTLEKCIQETRSIAVHTYTFGEKEGNDE